MFNEKSFKVFEIAGLEPRMVGVRAEIQPVFQEIGEAFLQLLSKELPEQDFYLHIAQHRRRTTHAPENTWSAISTKARGYKMEAHFQLGIWGDYVFVYLSVIDQPKDQKNYAEKLAKIKPFPNDFVFSKDHTQAQYFPIAEIEPAIERLKAVKKSELELGRIWEKSVFDDKQDQQILTEMKQTILDLLPIYQVLMGD